MSHVRRVVIWSVIGAAALAAGIGAVLFRQWMNRIPSRRDASIVSEFRATLHPPAPTWIFGDEPYREGVWSEVLRAYRRHGERPVWISGGRPTPLAYQFAIVLARGPDEGIDPAPYGYAAIRADLDRAPSGTLKQSPEEPTRLARLELRLTAAFLRFMRERHDGRFPERSLDPDWCALRDTVTVSDLLDRALASRSLARVVALTERDDTDYGALRQAAAAYNRIRRAGGWPEISSGATLSRGDSGPRCVILSRRLAASGDLDGAAGEGEFDTATEKGLRRYQARNGIPVNGRLDETTRQSLNVTVGERLQTITLNLERLRWRPRAFPEPYVRVNIPESRLRVRSAGLDTLEMRAVVGSPTHPTPVFSDAIVSLDFNPTWRVPRRIVVEEIAPALKKDSDYLEQNDMLVWRVKRRVAVIVTPGTVPWEAASQDTFGYLVRQEGGPTNPLGRIKFLCPNEYDVYLHDTPSHGLFGSVDRFRSHGCVRVEHPRDLAEFVLRGTPIGNRDSIDAIISSKWTRRVRVAAPTPIHIEYQTAWVDSLGAVQFRRDIYGLDRRMEDALKSGHVSDFVINPPAQWKPE